MSDQDTQQSLTFTQSRQRFCGAESFSFLKSFGWRMLKTSVTEETWSWHSWSHTASSARLSSWPGSQSLARLCWNFCLESEFPICSLVATEPGDPEDNVLNR